MLTKEQREKIIEKIIYDVDEEELFQRLGLDLHEIFINALKQKNDDQLLNFILD